VVTLHIEKEVVTWVAVADEARTRIFAMRDKFKPWTPVHDLATDRGTLHDGVTHASTPTTESPDSPHRLGHELLRFLEKSHSRQEFSRLALVAPPHLLGFLRKHIPRDLEPCLTASLAKEYIHLEEPELRKHLADHLLP
jgi:protein required for attachment to host cells